MTPRKGADPMAFNPLDPQNPHAPGGVAHPPIPPPPGTNANVPPLAVVAGTNQGNVHQGGPFGAIPNYDPVLAYQAAANSPALAAAYQRAAKGQTGPSRS